MRENAFSIVNCLHLESWTNLAQWTCNCSINGSNYTRCVAIYFVCREFDTFVCCQPFVVESCKQIKGVMDRLDIKVNWFFCSIHHVIKSSPVAAVCNGIGQLFQVGLLRYHWGVQCIIYVQTITSKSSCY